MSFSLHDVAFTQEVVMLLLKFNADVSLINAEGHTAKHLARNTEIRGVIEGM